jgi:hypothetical protein
VCVCTNGVASTVAGCSAEVMRCVSCNGGYYLSDNACVAYTCTTSSGAGCATCVPITSRTTNNQCDTCNIGYHITTGKICKVCELHHRFA